MSTTINLTKALEKAYKRLKRHYPEFRILLITFGWKGEFAKLKVHHQETIEGLAFVMTNLASRLDGGDHLAFTRKVTATERLPEQIKEITPLFGRAGVAFCIYHPEDRSYVAYSGLAERPDMVGLLERLLGQLRNAPGGLILN